MKKLIILSVSILFLMTAFACDGPDSGTGCDGPDRGTYPNSGVPTCGSGVIYDRGISFNENGLFVNWNGPGAPLSPSNNPGFGENGEPRPLNAYAWDMVSFDGHLYVGTQNRINDQGNNVINVSEGAEVWRYEPGATVNSGIWQQEIDAGFTDQSNMGVRAMAVYNDQLFAGTFNLDKGTELWRRTPDTATGRGQWEVIADAGLGDVDNDSVRTMAEFNGKLYIGTKNQESGADLFKFDADTQTLSLVDGGTNGIIGSSAGVISELVPFGDHLWIFTWGSADAGLVPYRMDRQENIERAKDVAANTLNSGIMSSAVFNGKIYVGTVNLYAGAQMYRLDNPTAADPMNVKWTRIGAYVFQPTEMYLWRLQVFAGQLYIGTWNPYKATMPQQSVNNIGATLYRMDQNEGFCQVMGHRRLIEEGFDKSENYGIRSMAELNGRLYIGTAQPFKIEPGSDDSNAANREGTEVWEFDPSN